MKLYYYSQYNSSTAYLKFKACHRLLKRFLSVNASKTLIMEFSETCLLIVQSGKEHKLVSEIITEVSTTIVDRLQRTWKVKVYTGFFIMSIYLSFVLIKPLFICFIKVALINA